MPKLTAEEAREELKRLTQFKGGDPVASAHQIVGLLARVIQSLYDDIDLRLRELEQTAAIDAAVRKDQDT